MSAPVTEAHRKLAADLCRHATGSNRALHHVPKFAQLIADSEARAVEIALAKSFTEYPVRMTLKDQDDARAERDQLCAEVQRLKSDGAASAFANMACRASRAETDRNNLRADLDAIKAILTEEKARADEAEHDCRVLIGQLNDALAELDGIRALAGRNKRYCFKGTARELVAALDQALDIAQAELKAEQDIRVINEIELKVSRAIVSKIWVQLGSPTYEQLKGRSIYDLIDEMKTELAAERARLDKVFEGWDSQCTAYQRISRSWYNPTGSFRAAIDAAMKEGT